MTVMLRRAHRFDSATLLKASRRLGDTLVNSRSPKIPSGLGPRAVFVSRYDCCSATR